MLQCYFIAAERGWDWEKIIPMSFWGIDAPAGSQSKVNSMTKFKYATQNVKLTTIAPATNHYHSIT